MYLVFLSLTLSPGLFALMNGCAYIFADTIDDVQDRLRCQTLLPIARKPTGLLREERVEYTPLATRSYDKPAEKLDYPAYNG